MDEATALVQKVKEEVAKLLSNVFTEVQREYEDMDDAVKLQIQDDLIDRRMEKDGESLSVESTRLVVSAGEELLRQSADVQRSLG